MPSEDDLRPASGEDLRAKWAAVTKMLFFDLDAGFFDRMHSELLQLDGPDNDTFRAFRESLCRAATVATMPFRTAALGASSTERMVALMVEINARLDMARYDGQQVPEQHVLRDTLNRIKEQYANETEEEKGRRQVNSVMSMLETLLTAQDYRDAAVDLLRQTLVSIWSAIEVLVNDILIGAINKHPALSVILLNQAPAKKHLQGRQLTVEALAQSGFDLSRQMGDLLLAERPLNSLEAIRDVVSVLAPGQKALHDILGSAELWKLWQRRHVIVHRASTVDALYMSRTADKRQVVGNHLQIEHEDVLASFQSAREVGEALAGALPFRP